MAFGTEAARTVAAAGSGVAGLREGDEVMTSAAAPASRDVGGECARAGGDRETTLSDHCHARDWVTLP